MHPCRQFQATGSKRLFDEYEFEFNVAREIVNALSRAHEVLNRRLVMRRMFLFVIAAARARFGFRRAARIN